MQGAPKSLLKVTWSATEAREEGLSIQRGTSPLSLLSRETQVPFFGMVDEWLINGLPVYRPLL